MPTQVGITTRATSLGHLKQVYDKRVVTQQNLIAKSWSQFPKSSIKVAGHGQGFFQSVNLLGNEAGGPINELEEFRPADTEETEFAQITPKVLIWPVEFSGLSDSIAKNAGVEAVVPNIRYNIDLAMERMLKELNFETYADGLGTYTLVNGAVAASTTIVVDSVQYLRENMVIDIFNAAGTVKQADSVRIVTVVDTTETITVNTAVTVDDNAIIVKENVLDSAPADGKGIAGLLRIIDDGTVSGTFENIDRSVATGFAKWRSAIVNAGVAAITNDLLQRTYDRTIIAGGDPSDMICSHFLQARRYLQVVTPLKRFQDDELDSGHTSIRWNGMRWVIDVDVQTAVVYFLNQAHILRYEVEPVHLADRDNSVFKWIPRADRYFAYFRYYGNLGSDKPNASARLENLSVPTL